MITSSRLGDDFLSPSFDDVAVGYSKSTYVLGIGGLKRDAMLNDAKRNLYLSYPLKPNQIFDNLTLDKKITYVVLYSKVEMILVADVVELDSNRRSTMSEQYREVLSQSGIKSKNYFSNYEPVLLLEKGKAYKGRIVSINKKSATVFYVNADGLIRVGNKAYGDIYKVSNLDSLKNQAGYEIGDEWNFSLQRANKSNYAVGGKIIGINSLRLLLETKSGVKSINKGEISSKD